MESVTGSALYATLGQVSDKTFDLDYCRDEIRGAPDAPGCRACLQNRPRTGSYTAWWSWGAYEPAIAMIHEEWARAAFRVMRDAPGLDERPRFFLR